MYAHYEDILSRIDAPPVWFDERAVPRYCEFGPDKVANIYASEVALVEILCQGCAHVFHVAFSELNARGVRIAEAIRNNALHFGDPPNVRCCSAGATMNSEPQRVLQCWRRHDERYTEPFGNGRRVTDSHRFHEWTRDPTLEVEIDLDWAKLRALQQG